MYLFAYGTLQPNSNLHFFENNQLSDFLVPKCRGSIKGQLLHIKNTNQNIEYPGVVEVGKGNDIVTGTVFEIVGGDEAFNIMDKHEGYNPELSSKDSAVENYYQRIETEVETENGEVVRAQVYVINRDSDYFGKDFIKVLGVIENGDWLSFV